MGGHSHNCTQQGYSKDKKGEGGGGKEKTEKKKKKKKHNYYCALKIFFLNSFMHFYCLLFKKLQNKARFILFVQKRSLLHTQEEARIALYRTLPLYTYQSITKVYRAARVILIILRHQNSFRIRMKYEPGLKVFEVITVCSGTKSVILN